jgi:TolB protein
MNRPHPLRSVRRRRRTLPLLRPIVAMILALALSSGAAQVRAAAPPHPAGLIAFVEADGAVAVVAPPGGADGAVVGRFGGGLERAQFPAWSSDGNRIAVIVSDLAGGRVDVIDLATGAAPATVYRMAGQAPIYLAWAPGDRTLAVLANASGGGLALDLVDVAAALAAPAGSAEAIRPFARGAPFYWTWSRSGRSLLVHQNVLSPTALVGSTGIDAFEVRAPLPDPGAFQSPALSSSERYVAYATIGADGQGSVVAVPNPERPDPSLRSATLPHRGMVALAWRPDREQLAVQRATVVSPHAFGPVDLLDVASGEVTRLSDDTVVASWWSPDGRWLATLSWVGGGGDRTVMGNAPGADAPRPFGGGPEPAGLGRVAAETAPVQGRGGALMSLKLVDVDARETRLLGAFVPSPLFLAQYLPFFDQYARSHRLWSPGSDALVLPALDDAGVPTLVVFGVDGSATPLVAGDLPAWNVR